MQIFRSPEDLKWEKTCDFHSPQNFYMILSLTLRIRQKYAPLLIEVRRKQCDMICAVVSIACASPVSTGLSKTVL